MAWFKRQDAPSTSSDAPSISSGEPEDQVHTADNPYCGDLSCWCHTNLIYHDHVTQLPADVSDEDASHVFSFFGIRL